MSRRSAPSRLPPPFLRQVCYQPGAAIGSDYPFNLSLFARADFAVDFDRPITILVGENGTGKSTLLEAIARQCGFALHGGNRNQLTDPGAEVAPLADILRLSWLPKVTTGFFLRAETFFNLASNLDAMFEEGSAYGDKRLHHQSHGEAFLALFGHRFQGRGIYIMDEPEAALSPSRQLAFLLILRRLEQSGEAQVLIASHSPMLIAYPGTQVLELKAGGIGAVDYRETNHFRLMRRFLDNPEAYFAHLFR